ncbi:hypothetical protein [Succinimonas sp.]|jgi:hypothetical protein|uniref:hypothetical protein n=1 Tax=Succinimonas sp. TaxID=1936151 RepID=UPI00386BA573
MTDRKLIIILYGLLILMLYIIYNDLLLFTKDGMEDTAEKAVRDAISKSGYEDLELRRISEYHCPRDWNQDDKEVLTLHCSASALFTDGTSAEVSIEQKEFRKPHADRSGREYMRPYRIIFSVTIQELGPDCQGEASISRIINI